MLILHHYKMPRIHLLIERHFQTLFVILFLCISSIQTLYGKEVLFFVPKEHEKYKIIDSLYNLMISAQGEVEKLEKKLIPKESIRLSDFADKDKFLKEQLKRNLTDTLKILNYYNNFKNYTEKKEKYFNELYPILKDVNKSKCFVILRKTRSELSIIDKAIDRYSNKDEEADGIEYGKSKLEIEPVEIEEPFIPEMEDEGGNPFEESDSEKNEKDTKTKDE